MGGNLSNARYSSLALARHRLSPMISPEPSKSVNARQVAFPLSVCFHFLALRFSVAKRRTYTSALLPMAPIDTRKTVLVSGANGFVGSAVVTAFVDAGYIVHATVRSKAKGEAWLSTRSAAVQSAVRLFEVPDITKDGAFDAAIKGVDVFAHTGECACHTCLL